MVVKKKDVEEVAKLAKLEFDDTEKNRIANELDEIVKYIDKLNELDTMNIEPTSHPVELQSKLREDIIEEGLTQEEVLSNAPAQKNGFFSVPKVIG